MAKERLIKAGFARSMTRPHRKTDFEVKEAGFSLISAIIAVAISSMLLAPIMTSASSMIRAGKTISLMSEEEEIRRLIRSRMNCQETIARLPKHKSSNILLFGRSTGPIMRFDVRKIMRTGKWKVRVTSYDPGSGVFTVLVRRPDFRDGEKRPLFRNSAPLVCAP